MTSVGLFNAPTVCTFIVKVALSPPIATGGEIFTKNATVGFAVKVLTLGVNTATDELRSMTSSTNIVGKLARNSDICNWLSAF